MSPHQSHGRGTYVLDRVFDGLGRIRVASGTRDPATFKAIDAMVTTLWHTARHDLLREIRDHRITPLQLFGYFREGKLDRLPSGEVLRPFGETWDAWARGLDCSPGHRKDLGTTRRALAAGDRTIADAVSLFLALKERKAGHATTVRKAKMHLLAFLRDTVTTGHPLYLDLKRIRIAKVEVQRKARPLSVAEVRALCAALPSTAAAMLWTLCATGMGPNEYWGVWRLVDDRVEIHGTKRAGRRRLVPAWTTLVRPAFGVRKLARLVAAARPDVILYDCRATFARWCEEAGVIRSHRSAYMGHGSRTMTEQYERGELPGQFAVDAAKLQAYVGDPDPTLRLLAARQA